MISTITVATSKEQVKTPNEEKMSKTQNFQVQNSIQNVWEGEMLRKDNQNTHSVAGICACKRINTWLL